MEQLLLKYKHGNNIHEHSKTAKDTENTENTENSKTSEPHKFVLNLSHRLDLRSSNKHAALRNVSIYYTWKI